MAAKKGDNVYFLETSALIAWFTNGEPWHQNAIDAVPDGADLCTDAICLAEALVRYSDADRENAKREIMRQVEIISLTTSGSKTAAKIFATCQKGGLTKNGQKQFIKVDTLILAAAVNSYATHFVFADEHFNSILKKMPRQYRRNKKSILR